MSECAAAENGDPTPCRGILTCLPFFSLTLGPFCEAHKAKALATLEKNRKLASKFYAPTDEVELDWGKHKS